MVFVLTNDDGIEAPGLQALRQAVGDRGVIVAPKQQHSGCGHQVTTHRPIHLEQRGVNEYAIEGTPADCTRIGLCHLYPNADWVLAGINAGGNLGADIYISGTVAAVREAALHRVPAIAISHYIQRKRPIDWDLATRLALRVLDKLLTYPIEAGTFWNVNLPHLEAGAPDPELIVCPLCTQPLPAEYRLEGEYLYYAGEYGKRTRDPGSDVDVCFSGHISMTQVKI
ncbi:5'/3'-nucleotidase SurE [Thermocoleostomius sinensis]|jgi:5'-nucleotidase|uniref:5'-nucleotidase n=1 Tax=Thermocoleostomius sinensis A174 TaxID=2016057 RepID=A0A9E8ZC59_9CYAN|nr:5'/3'-nucleotidase SurE [Thermocoleostomius sinensis]WAL60549.1 5'/3'-nucleotidase SurE [Thermocoleostomius sinensis A174]